MFPLTNVNAANLAGCMWYLQNEIISGAWGKANSASGLRFGITRILRYKVTMRATQPLLDAGMHFGLRVAFDSGQCTNPGCKYDWWKYGYNIGCNKLGDYPFPEFETYYPGGVWYSLPGQCPMKRYNEHTPACEEQEPGGYCPEGSGGMPSGQGNCTYVYENAGELRLEELYQFAGMNQEKFWEHRHHIHRNKWKVDTARRAFEHKFPSSPKEEDLHEPPCDFSRSRFYR